MTIDYITIAIAACSILGTLGTQRLLDFFRSKDQKVALELQILSLQQKDADRVIQVAEKVAALEKDNRELQTEKEKYFGRKVIQSKYTVDEPTGDLVLNALHFCSPCFHDGSDPPHEIQMRKNNDGQYQCPKCNLPRQEVRFSMPSQR